MKQVSRQDFSVMQCNISYSPMAAAYTIGFAGITLRRTLATAISCGLVGGHCQAGHKVDIMVIPASMSSTTVTTATASSPSPSRTSTAAIAPTPTPPDYKF
ncbi:hypothetical protein Ddye_018255 [Dipteronia dyeriana]|uniref:Uncharacterized protein n=1 Tax=Dipteronia dyeriana TaxID=168575 RepID=A0AAD9UAQ3_9ROSI|nr:hypothetical protein Ddye_018255 [Dipteronia dyeriana]